ncbi:cbb3-type cytochrome oxidase subunit 3 [Alcaligenes endophyticus]|uniref:CcoQ/FixQ family Cbb3-type cytochrome c oxidase assembly chaperone n=1 Tax=Alcaligenes endophyticus TaxID=1929088 RepID=A0ABT8EIM7_9BURK|nr:CcoQ/FixQ family Cbb3-type cytochrome c oxidase assembly chaperone [Alcaligenes endophyticus]MCX5592672.1 CcoQ/FixQ family Cbb3-type cytochrome c oxidase assembly chaperone [Alcaligenes endophyticus]MDN4120980.1 CcoQ/FixQ family Cbb3-type cytochrome c oxidase assembly chaperone [Alcaligenes endophyticus]
MIGILNAIVTTLAMITFFGICWWAFSRGRKQANEEASRLPFDLPDEGDSEKHLGGSNE